MYYIILYVTTALYSRLFLVLIFSLILQLNLKRCDSTWNSTGSCMSWVKQLQ